ncbi:helix-turn-helix domain-containing protein [bacterium]|nr:helix-turn-helix domain-containing protein [bacterium]
MSNIPQLLTEQEVSRMIRRAVQTLRNDRNLCRGIPYCRIGRSVRYKLSDVQEFVEARRIEPEGR